MPTSTKPVGVNIKEVLTAATATHSVDMCFGRRPRSPVEGPWTGAGTDYYYYYYYYYMIIIIILYGP